MDKKVNNLSAEHKPEESLQDLQIKLEKITAYVNRTEQRLAKYQKELAKLRKVKQDKELKKLLTLNKDLPVIDHNNI